MSQEAIQVSTMTINANHKILPISCQESEASIPKRVSTYLPETSYNLLTSDDSTWYHGMVDYCKLRCTNMHDRASWWSAWWRKELKANLCTRSPWVGEQNTKCKDRALSKQKRLQRLIALVSLPVSPSICLQKTLLKGTLIYDSNTITLLLKHGNENMTVLWMKSCITPKRMHYFSRRTHQRSSCIALHLLSRAVSDQSGLMV